MRGGGGWLGGCRISEVKGGRVSAAKTRASTAAPLLPNCRARPSSLPPSHSPWHQLLVSGSGPSN